MSQRDDQYTRYGIDVFQQALGKTTNIRVYAPNTDAKDWDDRRRSGAHTEPPSQRPEARVVCVASTIDDAEKIVAALNLYEQ